MQKIININHRVNFIKWAVNKTLAYPILLILSFEILVIGIVFNNYLLSLSLVINTIIIIYMFGFETNGITNWRRWSNFLEYQMSKKLYAKKHFYKGEVNKYDDMLITLDEIYKPLDIANSGDNEELKRFLMSVTDKNLNFNIRTAIQDKVNSSIIDNIQDSKTVPYELLPVYKSLIDDLEGLVNGNEFKDISNILTVSIKNDDKEKVKLKAKELKNAIKTLVNQNNNKVYAN